MNSKLEPLDRLTALIAAWPGLVSDSSPELVRDCLVLLDHLGGARTLIDVGSGGGLPGLVLKLARPELEVTLLEANHRKTAFLEAAGAQLGLRVRVLAARAEEAAHRPELRESFDVATARALAPMPVLVELCLPFVRVGGRLLAMKAGAEAEVEAALPALERLGGRLLAIEAAPSAARERGQVVVVEKVAPSPAGFPRRPGVPGKRPLGG